MLGRGQYTLQLGSGLLSHLDMNGREGIEAKKLVMGRRIRMTPLIALRWNYACGRLWELTEKGYKVRWQLLTHGGH